MVELRGGCSQGRGTCKDVSGGVREGVSACGSASSMLRCWVFVMESRLT